MSRKLAKSTVARLTAKLEAERDRLQGTIASLEEEMQDARIAEAAADHSADPDNVDGGSIAVELEKEISLEQNATDLLDKVERALVRVKTREYGVCEICGKNIPLARLEALPYVTTCVSCANSR